MKTLRSSFIVLMLLTASLCAGAHTAYADAIIRAPNNLGLVGYWSFDEGRGTQASDLSGNGNDGALKSGPTWTIGKSKGALEFDGVNDWVDGVVDPAIQTSPNEFTVSGFIYPENHTSRFITPSSNGIDQWIGYQGGAERIEIVTVEQAEGPGSAWRSTAGSVPIGEWTHWAVSIDDKDVKIYINGELDSEYVSSLNIANWTGKWVIGQRGNSTNWFNGKLDELRIYNRALSEAEVQSLYNSTSSTLVGRTPTEQYSDGLVAHYTFDGNDTTATTVSDVAQGNDGTIHGNVTPVMGRIGQGMHFGGSASHYIEAPHSTDLDVTALTLAMWIKTPSTMNCSPTCYRALISKQEQGVSRDYNLYTYTSNGETVTRMHFSSAEFGSHAYDLTEPFDPNTWHHVAVTVDSNGDTVYYADGAQFASTVRPPGEASNNYPLWIGRADNSWNGAMDDVRVYNRDLSASEILGLYSATRPSSMTSSTDSLVTNGLVGHWSFDPQTIDGTTVADVSINKNHGTVSGSGGITQVSGAVGGGIQFTGSSARVLVGDPPDDSLDFGTGDFSLSLWVYVDSLPYDWKTLVTKGASGSVGYEIEIDSGNRYTCSIQATGGTNTHRYGPVATTGKWQHVVCVYDRDVGIIQYVDGEFVFNNTFGGGNTNSISTDYPLTLGARETGGWAFDGALDEVRIYDHALSVNDIQQLYSMGQ